MIILLGVKNPDWHIGCISAHGDKFYQYRGYFEEAGIHFYHGAAIALLSYIAPYSKEVRKTDDKGWVRLEDWVIDNYERFERFLPEIVERG